MPKDFTQRGFIPIIIIIIGAIIFGTASVTIIKNLPRNKPQPTPDKNIQTPSPSPSLAPKFIQETTQQKKPSPTSTTNPQNSNNSTTTTTSSTPTTTSNISNNPKATGNITVLYPNGGESIDWSSPITIRWSASGFNKVSIRLNKGSGHFLDLAIFTNNTGSFSWTPSNQIAKDYTSGNFQISVEGHPAEGGPTTPDLSDGSFTFNVPSSTPINYGVIKGTVKLTSGILLKGVSVNLTCDNCNKLYNGNVHDTITDNNGNFTFEKVPPGIDIKLIALVYGNWTNPININLTDSQTITKDILVTLP